MDAIEQSIESKTIHGIVDDHKKRSAETGEPETIQDHLIKDEIHDVPTLKTLYRQIFVGCKVGGPFHEHLGSVYVLAKHAGGRQPEGFGDEPPFGYDKLKPNPNKALLIAPMRKAAEGPFQLSSSAPAVLTAARDVATIPSRRKQENITAGSTAQHQEMALLRQENEHLKEKVDWLEREIEALRSGRPPMTALPGRRPATPPAPNGNGGAHA